MFAVERMMRVFFEKRRTPFPVMVLSYLLYFISSSLAFLFINIPIIAILLNLSTFFIISLNYESPMIKKFIATACSFLFFVITEGLVFNFIYAYPTHLFDSTEFTDYWGFLLLGSLSYLIALILCRFKNIRKNTIARSVFWTSALAIPIFSIIIILLATFSSLPTITTILIIGFMFGINLLTLYLHDTLLAAYEDKLKSMLHTQEREYYFNQCQLMQESADSMKSFKHDITSHLSTLKDYSIKSGADKVTDYLVGLLGDIAKTEAYSNTGNVAFDSVINYKLRNAKADGMGLDIRVFVPPVLHLEVADAVTILSNLLDNALDAVAKVGEKVIKLEVEYSKGGLFIKADNSFDGKVKYADDKAGEEKRLVTLKSDGEHGHGLKNIQKAIDKYNGYIKISHTDDMFSVVVFLYVDEEKMP